MLFFQVRNFFSCIKSRPPSDGDDSSHNVKFAGGNVCLITTKENWDQKLAEAQKEGKVVRFITSLSLSPCHVIYVSLCVICKTFIKWPIKC